MMHVILGELGGFVLGNACMYVVMRSRVHRAIVAIGAALATSVGAEAHWADVAAGLTHDELQKRLGG